MSNVEEIKARRGPIIAVATEGDTDISRKADDVIYIPRTVDCLQPLLAVVPLQLLAYHIAVLRGCDVETGEFVVEREFVIGISDLHEPALVLDPRRRAGSTRFVERDRGVGRLEGI